MTAQWTPLIDWTTLPNLFVDAATMNQQIRENQEFLRSRPLTAATIASTTTTSTTFIQMVGSEISVTSFGGNMMIIGAGRVGNSTAGQTNYLDLAIDGTRVGDATVGLGSCTTYQANYTDIADIVHFTTIAPLAGSHLYSIHWRTTANTLTGLMRIYAMEIR